MSGARAEGGTDFQAEKIVCGELGVTLCKIMNDGPCVLC